MGTVLLLGLDAGDAEQVAVALLSADPAITVVRRDESSTLEAQLLASRPEVVLVGPLGSPEDALATAGRVRATDGGAQIVMVAAEPTTDFLRAAMRVGVRDVLSANDAFDEVARAVAGALDGARAQAGPVPQVAPATADGSHAVVTVFGTKGGVGKSVVATNLAVALAREGRSVALLDLDLQCGDTGIMLQLAPERTIYDAVQQFDRLDSDMLGGFMAVHSSGCRALLAPVRPEEAECVTSARVGAIIDILRDAFDLVVIDTPASFNDVVLTALEKSDQVLAIATMDVPSVKNVKVSLQKLDQLGLDRRRVRLVLNRADSKVGLQPSDVEEATGCGIVARIPSDRLVPRAVNMGVPVVMDAPRAQVSRSLLALAGLVTSTAEEVSAYVAQ